MKATHPIVLIDDDRAWLETLSDFFEEQGYRVRTALGGRQGLALLQEGDVGLVIVDFNMPEMNGLELLHQVLLRGRDLAVMFLSSEDDPTLPARVLDAGARAFLSKTMAPAKLMRALLEAVRTLYPEQEQWPWERLLPAPLRREIGLPVLRAIYNPERN